MVKTVALALGIVLGSLGAIPAVAQEVPQLVDGAWVLPPNTSPESTGMGPDATGGYQAGSYEAEIYAACAYHGCDPNQLIRVMYCESGGNHNVVGPNGELGIFQYHPYGMWPHMAGAGPYEQIWHAAEQFANGYGYHWVCQ